jgi:hypothetical protein
VGQSVWAEANGIKVAKKRRAVVGRVDIREIIGLPLFQKVSCTGY